MIYVYPSPSLRAHHNHYSFNPCLSSISLSAHKGFLRPQSAWNENSCLRDAALPAFEKLEQFLIRKADRVLLRRRNFVTSHKLEFDRPVALIDRLTDRPRRRLLALGRRAIVRRLKGRIDIYDFIGRRRSGMAGRWDASRSMFVGDEW